jgi:hypothetical protein
MRSDLISRRTYRTVISTMRHAKLAMLLPAAALVAAVVPAAAARATTTATQPTAFTCYPNTPLAFNFTSSAVVDKQVTTTLADGTKLPAGFVAQSDPPYYPTKTSGLLIDSFTNETTQKTIYRNDSGTNWFTYDPTPKVPGALATGTFITIGSNAESFGPKSLAPLQAAGIHEPALVFVHGLLVMQSRSPGFSSQPELRDVLVNEFHRGGTSGYRPGVVVGPALMRVGRSRLPSGR